MFGPGGPGGVPMAMAGLAEFDTDSDEEEQQQQPTPQKAPPKPAAPPGAAPGGANHRPLVGGFAAAAYEAARADHYARMQAQKAKKAGARPQQQRVPNK